VRRDRPVRRNRHASEPPRTPEPPVRRPRRTDRPRSPAAHDWTHLRGAKVAQIPPNPSIQRGFVPQSLLSDTHPAHPSKLGGAS
jgi:hypothetical protein